MEKSYQLFEHQKQAILFAKNHTHCLIYRLPGTGKTYIGLELVESQLSEHDYGSKKILWIGPAHLIPQYENVFLSLGIPFNSYSVSRIIQMGVCNFISYELYRGNSNEFLHETWDLVICDEFHRAKNKKTLTNKTLWKLRGCARSFVAFTGTPFQNSPYEFFELISLVSGKNMTPTFENYLLYKIPRKVVLRNFLRKVGFNISRANQGPIIGIKNRAKLAAILTSYVDFLPAREYLEECKVPQLNESVVNVEMNKTEILSYQKILKQFRKNKDKQFLEDNLSDEKIETSFNRLSRLRQLLLGSEKGWKESSKIARCVEDCKNILVLNNSANILVFSNFVKNGIDPAHKALCDAELSPIRYDGSTSKKQREKIVATYLQTTGNILLLSPVGFEGLDLYGTSDIFVLDPHYNPERTKQLISRAYRAFSSIKKIDIVHYCSVSQHLLHPTIDQAILAIAERKRKLSILLEECLVTDI